MFRSAFESRFGLAPEQRRAAFMAMAMAPKETAREFVTQVQTEAMRLQAGGGVAGGFLTPEVLFSVFSPRLPASIRA